MKYAIIIPDGCADDPVEALGNRTPLQVARTPHMDAIAQVGRIGLSNNVPASLTPASDVATLSLFGYDPLKYYTGRAPLEAVALGIRLGPHDWAVRCNLVTIEYGRMKDFTAGHISSDEGRELIQSLQENLGTPALEFHPGVSYRNILVVRSDAAGPFSGETKTQAPHDVPDQLVEPHLPSGPGAELLRGLMDQSKPLLAEHAVSLDRLEFGKPPATQIWLWGQGQAPTMPSFGVQYGKRGAIITAVDLVRGVGALLGWDRIEVPGATGYLDTDYAAKGRYAVEALSKYDLVCVHVEAPDEASHEGNVEAKVEALEEIDEHIVGPVLGAIRTLGDYRILIEPDHRTTLRTHAHSHGAVPFAMAGTGIPAENAAAYDEAAAAQSSHRHDPGWNLMSDFLNP